MNLILLCKKDHRVKLVIFLRYKEGSDYGKYVNAVLIIFGLKMKPLNILMSRKFR